MTFCNSLHIGDNIPNFKFNSTFGEFEFNDFKGKWLILFSHPGNFTPVCTTEFLAFTSCYNKLKELDTELLALSIGSIPSHLSWIHNIYTNSKIAIPFPIISDIDGSIAKIVRNAIN